MYVSMYRQQNTHDTHTLHSRIHTINYKQFVPKTGVQLNIQEAMDTLIMYSFYLSHQNCFEILEITKYVTFMIYRLPEGILDILPS